MTKAYGRCRPRGRADAPTAPCKTRGRVSHSAHRRITRGHFYFVKNGDISISPWQAALLQVSRELLQVRYAALSVERALEPHFRISTFATFTRMFPPIVVKRTSTR